MERERDGGRKGNRQGETEELKADKQISKGLKKPLFQEAQPEQMGVTKDKKVSAGWLSGQGLPCKHKGPEFDPQNLH